MLKTITRYPLDGMKMQHARGADHGRSVLDESEALKIFNDRRSYRKVAADFNVSHSTVQAIKQKRIWKHIHEATPVDTPESE